MLSAARCKATPCRLDEDGIDAVNWVTTVAGAVAIFPVGVSVLITELTYAIGLQNVRGACAETITRACTSEPFRIVAFRLRW